MQGGDVFKLVGSRKADVLLTFLWNGKREGGLPLKCYERGKFARFECDYFAVNFYHQGERDRSPGRALSTF